MIALLQVGIFLIIVLALLYWQAPLRIWLPVTAVSLILLSNFDHVSLMGQLLIWLIYLAVILFFVVPPIRCRFITKPILNYVRKVLPSMSVTEREALEAGDTWWESDLFRGRPDWDKLIAFKTPVLTQEEQLFVECQVEQLCEMLDDWKITHELCDLPETIWDFLKRERFFGLVLPKQYGGLGFSPLAHSTVVTKLASRSISCAVTAMVPNSLGPGELLVHYGTEEQKNYYLPRLASGEEIPCFALTSQEAGSDAAAMTDYGIITRGNFEGKEIVGIQLNFNKRYITLAPIATVMGLAFKLYDPDHLLGNTTNIGITVCLIPTTHPGISIGKRHFPLDTAFLNGPIQGENVFIPIDWVIGGQEKIGQGWRMLMECLSIGRGISLPAISVAASMVSYRMSGAYAAVRQQFKLPIGRFEGVEDALAKIGGFTYIQEACRRFSLIPLYENLKPAISSAIAKYHMTEVGRKVINHAMDIHGGHAIQLGPHNYLGRIYEAIPICITVEGANILTRNLIIFGQGAIRCHPYIFEEMQAVHLPDEQALPALDKVLFKHIGYIASNFIRVFVLSFTAGRLVLTPFQGKIHKFATQLTRMSAAFALTSDITMMLLGGSLKRKEDLSARLGDVLSQLFIASAVLKYYQDEKKLDVEQAYVKWCLQHCLHEIQLAFDGFFTNFPNHWLGKLLSAIVFPWGRPYRPVHDRLGQKIAEHMQIPSELRNRLTKSAYFGTTSNDPTGRIEVAFNASIQMTDLMKKFKDIQHDPRLNHLFTLPEKLEKATEIGLLTQSEKQKIIEFEKARIAAIKVDDFDFNYFSRKGKN